MVLTGAFYPSTGRCFPLKYLFGTCLKNFLIDHCHAVLLCQYVAKRGGIFGDVALIVIRLGGAKKEVKEGMAS